MDEIASERIKLLLFIIFYLYTEIEIKYIYYLEILAKVERASVSISVPGRRNSFNVVKHIKTREAFLLLLLQRANSWKYN